MNLLKVYLEEVHEEKPYNSDWCEEFLGEEFTVVTATWECYGKSCKKTDVYNTKMWSKIKERGYYMG